MRIVVGGAPPIPPALTAISTLVLTPDDPFPGGFLL